MQLVSPTREFLESRDRHLLPSYMYFYYYSQFFFLKTFLHSISGSRELGKQFYCITDCFFFSSPSLELRNSDFLGKKLFPLSFFLYFKMLLKSTIKINNSNKRVKRDERLVSHASFEHTPRALIKFYETLLV